jgi:hypothetical protein
MNFSHIDFTDPNTRPLSIHEAKLLSIDLPLANYVTVQYRPHPDLR